MMKLVSIIVPVYNVETYLKECLESIIFQDYKNIEVIAVNDGSTDSSGEILQKYATIDNRIKVFHKSNGGLASARNYGLAQASGEYILFVDSDDLIAPNSLSTLIEIASIHDADIISFGLKKFYKNTNIKEITNSSSKIAKKINKEILFKICFDEGFGSDYCHGAYVCARFYKSASIRPLLFNKNRLLYEDEDFTSKLILSLSNDHQIILFDSPIYYYRQRKSSLVHSKRIHRLFALYSCRREILKHCVKGSIEFSIIDKARLLTLTKIMQTSLASNRSTGFTLYRKILLKRNDLSIKTKLPYLLGFSVARNYSVKRLEKNKQKNLKLQYWD